MSQPTGRSRRQWEAFVQINGRKIPREELIRQMVADGLSEQEAQNILSKNKKSKIKSGLFMLCGGLVLCVLGIVATISSYSNTSDFGDSRFYVYWGAVLCGAIMIFIGLFRLIFRRN
jgi:hypothetical protein